MEKLLQPLKQEGFTEEIWKSLTTPHDTETDLLSDGENHTSPNQSPNARGTKRTADGETKQGWDATDEVHQVKVQSPPAAMPPEGRADVSDDDDDEDFRPNM
jgi:hypothetical protein